MAKSHLVFNLNKQSLQIFHLIEPLATLTRTNTLAELVWEEAHQEDTHRLAPAATRQRSA